MQKGIKFRAYPNKQQQNLINQTLGCCRFIYNKGLAMRHDELAAELLNIVGFTVDGRKEVINELVIYADRYEVPTPQKSKNPNKKIPSIPPENEDTWEEVESLENKDPFSF